MTPAQLGARLAAARHAAGLSQRQDVSSIDQFIVYLNMMQRGLDYRACRLSLLRDRPPRATIRRPMKGVITPADWPVLASGQRRTQE